MRTARNFNHPLKVFDHPLGDLVGINSLPKGISLEGSPALILDGLKRGEDDEDVSQGELPSRKGRSIILRVYESLGGKARGKIVIDRVLGVESVHATNVLEDDGEKLDFEDGSVNIELRAFEVATFRLQLSD